MAVVVMVTVAGITEITAATAEGNLGEADEMEKIVRQASPDV